MERGGLDRGIDLTQIWNILYLRWRIIGVALLAALAIAFVNEVRADDPEPESAASLPETSATFIASAVYAVVTTGDDDSIPIDEATRFGQALAPTYLYALTTDSVNEALLTTLELPIPPDELTSYLDIRVISGTQFISVTAEMDRSDYPVAVVNGYVDALSASEAYSYINLGGFGARLELVEPAYLATLVETDAETVAPLPITTYPEWVLFAIVGLMLGVFGALGVEWVDGRANWPSQVSGKTGLIAIGKARALRNDDVDIESYRTAKARINRVLPRGAGGRSLVVTSASSGEGKTTVVSNLARALAEDGSSVVILSADVRSMTAIEAGWLDSNSQAGLSEYLNDSSIKVDDVVIDTTEPGISIVTRGGAPDSVVPLVDSDRMVQLMDSLVSRADWVIVDASPVLESADAARLAPMADGTMLVVDGKRTTLSAAQSTTAMLADAGAVTIGFFHNRVRVSPISRLLNQEPA